MTRVITSSVVRSTHKGESHGGVYLVDLQSGEAEQVVDWNDETISWEGRGADRGLRGIAFHGDAIYLAASDEIFVFSPDFTIIDSFRNAYLKHCHEITIHGDTLYLTSTGFDSILLFDLKQQRFTQGYCLRSLRQPRREWAARLLGSRTRRLVPFDPNGSGGPQAADTFHINSVHVTADGIYLCGTKLAEVLRITPGGALETVARVPEGSHNARPYGEHILLNDTPANRIAILERGGTLLEEFPVILYPEQDLECANLPKDYARQGWARGLCLTDDGLLVGGSSPATITVYERGRREPVQRITITMDVRNAIHGLEVWPE